MSDLMRSIGPQSDSSGQELLYYNDFWSNYREYNKIENGLFLGSEAPIRDCTLLLMLDINYILSVTEKPVPQENRFGHIRYHHIEAGDFPDQDLLSSFDECFKFITNVQNKGGNVFVHCVGGVSRSATIVIAFLMKKYKLLAADAIKKVSKKRKVFPNEGFREQLDLYERMYYMADGSNEEYRRFLLKSLTYKLRTGTASENEWKSKAETDIQFQMSLNYEQNFVRNYFNKIAIAEQAVDVDKGLSYHCFLCNTELFNEINIIGDKNSKVISSSCPQVFIEPLQTYCTQSETDKTGFLKCPNCLQIFGSYNWLLYHCNCLSHYKYEECLALKVYPKRISI